MKKQLTKKQLEAVQSNSTATMVIAGPGTGKTHILASRIEHLVRKRKISSEDILALTFTESGARQMQKRVISFLGADGYAVTINTFHSFAASLIDKNPEIFGYKHTLKSIKDIERAKIVQNILDDLDNAGKLNELRTPEDKYFYYRDISRALSTIKREGFSSEEFSNIVKNWQNDFNAIPDEEKISTKGPRKGLIKREYEKKEKRIHKNKELALIYKKYQKILKDKSYYDYEDMIIQVIKGLNSNEDLLHELHLKYKAILVDEYQDTSGAQNKLLFLLISENPNIFIVGDDDQAIFRFQGATIQNFTEFLEKFPQTNIVTLEDNFRSNQLLINAALSISNKNTERLTSTLNLPDKVLYSRTYGEGQKFQINEFETDLEEHAYLIDEIKKMRKQDVAWKDIAIITRTNKEQGELSELLRQHDIPTSLSADQNALDNPHVASLLVMVSAFLNPHNSEAMITYLLHPATPIKTQDVWSILAIREKNESIYETMQKSLKKDSKINFLDTKKVAETFDIINELSSESSSKSGSLWLQNVLLKTGLMQWIFKQKESYYIIENIRALIDEAKRVRAGNSQITIHQILNHFQAHRQLNIPLKISTSSRAFENTVRIMTAHNVKGQEFDHVFIVHAIDTNWSHAKKRDKLTLPEAIPSQEQNTNDERRIFYVALTRAKHSVFISYAKLYTKGISGLEDKGRETMPSLFINELKETTTITKVKKDIDKFIKTIITKEPYATDLLQKEIIKNIVQNPNFTLTATNYNSFIQCPLKFLYEYIFRVPRAETFSLTYGSAIHLALQRYFEVPKEKRNLNFLLHVVSEFIEAQSMLSKSDNSRLLKRAENTLRNYHEERLIHETQPLYLEYMFKKGDVSWDDVRISGKIDKISSLGKNSVVVVDYKTNKNIPSINAILGKTQDTNAPNSLRQLLFYKLLLETSANFKYKAEVFSLDYIEHIKELPIPIENDTYEEFKTTLKKVWNSIQTLEFLEQNKNFPHCGKCKYCKLQT